jgi:hypothetical protein
MPELGGIIRAGLAGLFGSMVAKGYLSADQAEQVINMVAGIAGIAGVAVWSFITNRLKNMLGTVAASPEVKEVVVTTDDLADSVPNKKVVAG